MGAEPRGFDAETEAHETRIPTRASAAAAPRARVEWDGAGGPRTMRLDRSALVGSSPSVPVRLDDPLVSRLHAELTVRPDGIWVRDLASKNGTFVEEVRVTEARVPAGGRVRVGSTVLRFSQTWDDAPESTWTEPMLGALVGHSDAMRGLFARLTRVAASTMPVLIQGETGAGKEIVARTLHERSRAGQGPFVVVDCASLTVAPTLVTAEAGTLFLDEVGDLPLAVQPALLRSMEAPNTNVRVMASTRRDLPLLVSEGAFREDLYFRLAVLPLTVPPLRERSADVAALVRAFLPPAEHGAVTPELVRDLTARPWRGNVRELRNFVERAMTFGTDEALELLAPPSGALGTPRDLPPVDAAEPFKVIRDRWVAHLEREYLRAVLSQTGGNVSAAAEAAGLDRAYVYRLIRKHGL
ncbi:MAG: sigma 54-interacting transcriptional regulator [Polyangiaceae bacterium]